MRPLWIIQLIKEGSVNKSVQLSKVLEWMNEKVTQCSFGRKTDNQLKMLRITYVFIKKKKDCRQCKPIVESKEKSKQHNNGGSQKLTN